MDDNVARFNTIINVRDFEGKKNQREWYRTSGTYCFSYVFVCVPGTRKLFFLQRALPVASLSLLPAPRLKLYSNSDLSCAD